MTPALLLPPIPPTRALTLRATSPLGVTHIIERDELGYVATCGRFRPEASNEAPGVPCAACARMTAPEVPWTKELERARAERNEAIRELRRRRPELTLAEVAARFETTERIAWLAIRRKR